VNISVKNSDFAFVPLNCEGGSKIGGYSALSHATFAADYSYLVLDSAQFQFQSLFLFPLLLLLVGTGIGYQTGIAFPVTFFGRICLFQGTCHFFTTEPGTV
jgi:hypothetical protein